MTVLQSKEKTVIESQSEEGLDVRLFFLGQDATLYHSQMLQRKFV